MKPVQYTIALLLISLATLSFADGHGGAMAKAQKMISTAEARLAKASAVGHEWTTTAPLLKKAKEAASKKDYSMAYELAHQADRQAFASLVQSIDSGKNWMLSVPQ